MNPDSSSSPRGDPDVPMEPAALGRRLAARLIDFAILALPSFVAFVVASLMALGFAWETDPSEGEFIVVWLLALSAAFLPIMLYEVALTARCGQTLGKDALGIMVARRDDGQLPTAASSFVRWVVPVAASVVGVVVCALVTLVAASGEGQEISSWVPVAVGGLGGWLLASVPPPWDEERRGLHDVIAGTIVIVERDLPELPEQPQPAKPATARTEPPGARRQSSYVEYWDDYVRQQRPPSRPDADDADAAQTQ